MITIVFCLSKKGVLTLLQNIKENKATDPDEIPGKFLKICAFELHEIFTILFQTSLNLGIVPDEWKVAHIFPLFKKGDKTKAQWAQSRVNKILYIRQNGQEEIRNLL